MPYRASRRSFLIQSTVSAGAVAAGIPAWAGPSNPASLKLLTSVDGVFVPPKGDARMKFSFPWPEPSVAFAGLLFGFEIITFENSYALDPALVTVDAGEDLLTLAARGFTWAGGQQKAAGHLKATIRRAVDGALRWEVEARFAKPIKAIKTIVRGLPRGRLSKSAGQWEDPQDEERSYSYPDLMGGMGTPLVAVEGKEGKVWAISAEQTEVRPARFYFAPGPDAYKLELLYEQAGWRRSGTVRTHSWRIGQGADFAAAAAPHFEHVKRAYGLPAFQQRPDAPAWMKQASLVLALHGQHWSGHIFNDYARQLEILKWASQRTDPRRTLVFLAGWDARYYWDYPRFDVDQRMGGEAAFRRLVAEGHAMGYRFLLMFGSNIANPAAPGFAKLAKARVRTVYGEPMASDYVDWDGDRKGDASMVFMNLAVHSWRAHLANRITDIVRRYNIDAYFLDICGLWENNPDGDMFVGLKMLVERLARNFPGVPPVGEMLYDAQLGIIPMTHVSRYPLYPKAQFDHVAVFRHLSHPAPGGSTGVHEQGYLPYKPAAIDDRVIPTITFVGDTLERHAALVEADIETANRRYKRVISPDASQ